MLKLSETFSLQTNQAKFGPKYESIQATVQLFSNSNVIIETKQETINFEGKTSLSVCFFQTKKSDNLPGVEIYLPTKTYLLTHAKQEIVNEWYYALKRIQNKMEVFSKTFTINLNRRKGYGITDDWHTVTVVADCCKFIIYSDCDLTKFRYEHAYNTISKITLKRNTPVHQNLLIFERFEGREIVFSHPDTDTIMKFMDFLLYSGIDPIVIQ